MKKRMQLRRRGERLSKSVAVGIESLCADASEQVMWIRKHLLNALEEACGKQSTNERSK